MIVFHPREVQVSNYDTIGLKLAPFICNDITRHGHCLLSYPNALGLTLFVPWEEVAGYIFQTKKNPNE